MTDASLIEALDDSQKVARHQDTFGTHWLRRQDVLAIIRQHQAAPVAEEDAPGLIYFADQLADSIEQLEREPMAWATENLREKQWWHRAKKNVEDYRRIVRLVMAALPTLKLEPTPLTEDEKRQAVELMADAIANRSAGFPDEHDHAEAALSALLERFDLRRRA
jgi:hypothetical protein